MSALLTLALALAIASSDAPAGAGPPATPQLTCEIGTHNWCIASIGGVISMTDSGANRVWTIEQKGEMRDGPLTIVESKACSTASSSSPRLLSTSVREVDGRAYVSNTYQINGSGCELEFRWPRDTADAQPYRQAMLFGVLVGNMPLHPEHLLQLYKLKAGE
jgi:hypothetical protein